ncbi:hypothetical protein FRB94_011688 [Tulasnella sp. JGI-2019a]|nr:hypothetical protein FRB93_010042 [Tulasnella sp. JGI-2019a]KAG8992370.1 hypothetical protein FRB94_011688 [Tulasnella sp. JGI-2019a]
MASLSKAANERQKRALAELLSLPGNGICADCMSTAPRWASWNLGVFICVQCAAAHRKLGTHISKVKSVTLDTWTKEQVESMKQLGPNTKANALYNPDTRRNPPPTNAFDSERDSELETFVRNKYQYKAFMARPEPTSKPSIDTSLKFRPSDISTQPQRTSPSPSLSSGGRNSFREQISSVSPTASNLMAEMELHSRALERKSTRPSSAGVNSSASANGTQFSSVGVTPSARPGTASSLNARRSVLSSSPIPVITTTPPPPKPSGGGFSWASNATATPDPPPKPRFSIPDKAPPPPPVQQAAAATQQSPPKPPPQPQPQRSLYEEDLMALQFGGPPAPPAPSAPAVVPNTNTNPFPMASSPFTQTMASPFGPGGMMSQATGISGSMGTLNMSGGAPSYMNGASATPMMTGGPSPANPFHAYSAGMNSGGGSTASFTPSPFQPSLNQPFAPSQPQFSNQPQFTPPQPQYQSQPQFTSPSSFMGTSPFQQQLQQQQQQPFQPSMSSAPFHANPYTPSPFNNANTNPFPTGQPNMNSSSSPFASFAQGMLPPGQQQQQQPQQSYNPFMQQQPQAGMGTGMNSWG